VGTPSHQIPRCVSRHHGFPGCGPMQFRRDALRKIRNPCGRRFFLRRAAQFHAGALYRAVTA